MRNMFVDVIVYEFIVFPLFFLADKRSPRSGRPMGCGASIFGRRDSKRQPLLSTRLGLVTPPQGSERPGAKGAGLWIDTNLPSRKDVAVAETPVGKQAEEYKYYCPLCMCASASSRASNISVSCNTLPSVTSLLSAHSQDVLQAGTRDAVLQAVALHLLSARVRGEAAGEAPAELERRARRWADGADDTARTQFGDSGGASAGGDGMPSVRLEEQGAAPSQGAAERRGGIHAIRGLPADACGDGQSAAEAAEDSRVAARAARKLADQGWGRL